MNDQRSFERFVADNVAGTSQGIPLPDDFYDDMHSFATTTSQRPEWLALIKEPPMRTNSRTTVGSPTVRVMAVMAATLLLIVAMAAVGAGVQRLLAADGEIIVDQAGNGDYATITEALENAVDGDEILVMPGAYAESFTIDKSVAIRGENRDDVMLTADPDHYAESYCGGADAYCVTGGPFSVKVRAENVRIEGLTLQDNGIRVETGSVDIEAVKATEVQVQESGTARLAAVDVEWILSMLPGSNTSVTNSRLCLVDVSSEAVIEGNIIGEDCVDFPDMPANELTLQGGIIIWESSTASLIDNAIGVPIDVRQGAAPTIEGNRITDTGGTAIRLFEAGDTTIRGNALTDNRVAILLPAAEGPSANVTIEQNKISGGRTGIALTGGSSQVLSNTIENVQGRAIAVGSEASAVLRDNTLCNNREDLYVDDPSTVDVDDSNEICEDGLPE